MRKLPVKIKSRFSSDKTSRLLIAASAFFLAALTISQLCLRFASTRKIFTSIEKYENITYASTDAVNKGYITITLISGEPSDMIEVLFNGETVGTMRDKSQKFEFECAGVFEIKNNSGKKIVAAAKSPSKNTEVLMSNKPEIETGIKVLCSLRLNGGQ